MKRHTSMRMRQTGVTLIELMVVVAIVGILAAVAYPNYRQQAMRGNRAEAKIALEQTAASLEKCYTRYLSYTDANCAVYNQMIGTGFPTTKAMYTVRGNGFTATTYSIIAVVQNSQSGDAQCLNFTLNERGARGVSGSLSSTPLQCWGR